MSLVRVMPTIFCSRAEPPEPGNLAEPLLGQRVEAGLRDDAEVAGERQLEADAEAEAAVGGDHRLGAARRRRDVPGELGDRLGRRLHEALDVAAAGKMLADRAQHDDAHARVLVERLEHQAKLVALRHRDDVERRPVEDDVGALARRVDLDAEAVERGEARIGKRHGLRTHALTSLLSVFSGS